VIADACGDIIQLGAVPMTSLRYLLELQRDWTRVETHESTTGIAKQWAGAYGLGATRPKTISGSSEKFTGCFW
jgi:hypothetical protein